MDKRTVVITGASTGIGFACAKRLVEKGFEVFCGVRSGADADRVKSEIPGIRPLLIDVTNACQIAEAAEQVEEVCGEKGLYGLVNNAGIVIAGPLECVSVEDFRLQMEVNVTGQFAVTRAFLPQIRTAQGRIVNMGSTSGFFSPPFTGPYNASKFAIEAMTDSLRAELGPWGIEVVVVQPGAIQTPIWEKSESASNDRVAEWSETAQQRYGSAVDKMRAHIKRVPKYAIPASKVADAVEHALTARRPRTRYLVGKDAYLQKAFVRLVPDRLRDRLIRRILGV